MAVDREQWGAYFESLPHWKCPTCNKGFLSGDKSKMLDEETGPSKSAHAHDDWEPEWVKRRFVGLLTCSHPSCKQIASVAGTIGVEIIEDWEAQHQTYGDFYRVNFIQPAPLPISIPGEAPKPVVEAIKEAASLFWSNAEAAANQIRQAVEYLMDDLGIPAEKSKGGRIMLHQRIEVFKKTDAENGEVLLAVKWLGNTGSHIGGLKHHDVLDAFDMIELVLENRYGTTKKKIMEKVVAINANKGPVKKKKLFSSI